MLRFVSFSCLNHTWGHFLFFYQTPPSLLQLHVYLGLSDSHFLEQNRRTKRRSVPIMTAWLFNNILQWIWQLASFHKPFLLFKDACHISCSQSAALPAPFFKNKKTSSLSSSTRFSLPLLFCLQLSGSWPHFHNPSGERGKKGAPPSFTHSPSSLCSAGAAAKADLFWSEAADSRVCLDAISKF